MKVYVVTLSLLLAACDKNDDVAFDYQQRVQTILETRVKELGVRSLGDDGSRYPRKRVLDEQQSQLQSSISIREFLSLRQCELHLVIAKRNSLIGKVAPASQLLFNDLQILNTAPKCIDQLVKGNNQLMAEKLINYVEQKESLIIIALWKAILGSRENTLFWHERSQPNDYPLTLNSDVAKNIKQLTQFVQKVKQQNYEFIEIGRAHV